MLYAPRRRGMVVNKPAPDFTLQDHNREYVNLKDTIAVAPAMLVFYPENFKPVCTEQLCDYRDHIAEFDQYGIQLFGISKNDCHSNKRFLEEHSFPFPLLSDPGDRVARQFGCTSLLLFGKVSRALFIINTKGIVLYRYVEPTAITRRKSHALIKVLEQLRSNSLL